ncbi:MAG TPA: STN domain-containing protein, partial [Niastella sp.]
MDVINKGFTALLVLILFTAADNACAQARQTPFYFDKPITLDSLTKYVHSRSKLRFSFNSTKVKGTQLIDLKKGAYSIDQLLQQIRKNTSLYYAMRNGYVIFQDNPPKLKITPPTVTKPVTTKPPVPKATTTTPQKPAPQLPVIKTTPTDTTKIKTDSTHVPDSIKVLLPILPRVQNKEEEEEEEEKEQKLRGRFNFSFGRKLIDTTI